MKYKQDLSHQARRFVKYWVIMFSTQILIIQNGTYLGLRVMPLSCLDYLFSVLIGIGGMAWFNLIMYLEEKWHDITEIPPNTDSLAGSLR